MTSLMYNPFIFGTWQVVLSGMWGYVRDKRFGTTGLDHWKKGLKTNTPKYADTKWTHYCRAQELLKGVKGLQGHFVLFLSKHVQWSFWLLTQAECSTVLCSISVYRQPRPYHPRPLLSDWHPERDIRWLVQLCLAGGSVSVCIKPHSGGQPADLVGV